MRLLARIFKWGILPLFGCAVLLAVYGFLIEPDRLVVRHLDMSAKHWPPGAPPLRMAVVADIHAGAPHIDEAKLDGIVRRINAEKPDITLLLGDYVIHGVIGGRFIAPETTAKHLARLRAPFGVISVLGNHDWWLDGPRVQRALEAAGIKVLENAAVRISGQKRTFWIAGLADDSTRQPDGKQALGEVSASEPVIAIMHDPASIDQIPPRVDLSLAGHTHGGQIYLPWLFPPVTPGRAGPDYAYGLIEREGKQLFVSAGIGTSIIPVRLNMPPEILIITLAGKGSG